jgi:hypothetical protein
MQTFKSTDTERNLAIELILEDVPGGGSIAISDLPVAQTELKAGTLVAEDSNGKWHVTKTAMLRDYVSASGVSPSGLAPDKTLWVYPQHTFKVGDLITYASGVASGVRITSITASGTEYDAILTGSYISVPIPASGLIIESATSGFPNVGFRYLPTAITTNTVDTTASGNAGAGLLVRGRVRQGEMPYPINATIKSLLPLIRFV